MPTSTNAKACGRKNDEPVLRPMRELLRRLTASAVVASPTAATLAAGDLAGLAVCAEASMRTVHLGLAALGQLVARCSMDLQDGSVPADSVESLGFLMAELGDLAAECMRIAAECRAPGQEIGSTGADGTHE